MKRVIALIIAAMMVAMSCVGFSAQTYESEDKTTIIYDETITIDNNEVCVCTYNITENYLWHAELKDTETDELIKVMGADCVDEPLIVKTTEGATYKFYQRRGSAGGGGKIFSYDNTGGVYRKARIKLSQYGYFNEDGSYTTDKFTYHFGDTEYVGESEYMSSLMILSGGVINIVAPDENGFVEIYISTNIGQTTSYYTDYSFKIRTETQNSTGGGGGINGGSMYNLIKGAVNGKFSSIDITNATKIQLYVAKLNSFDTMQKYRADVNNNDEVDILDATKIQRYLAKLDE